MNKSDLARMRYWDVSLNSALNIAENYPNNVVYLNELGNHFYEDDAGEYIQQMVDDYGIDWVIEMASRGDERKSKMLEQKIAFRAWNVDGMKKSEPLDALQMLIDMGYERYEVDEDGETK